MNTAQLAAGAAAPRSMALYLCGAGAALWALIMVLGPDPGFTANWPWLALFWALQIGIGLAVLHRVLHLLRRLPKLSTWPAWLLVAVSGVAGSFVLAPIYWLIGEGLMQQALGFPATIDDDDAGIQRYCGSGDRRLAADFLAAALQRSVTLGRGAASRGTNAGAPALAKPGPEHQPRTTRMARRFAARIGR
jgi:hypothetical protein